MTLHERLEAAQEGSRELSDEVLQALGYTLPGVGSCGALTFNWRQNADGTFTQAPGPNPTESVDDALALLPGKNEYGLEWRVFMERKPCGTWSAAIREHAKDGWQAMAATAPLALCAALVKAADPNNPHI